MVIAKVVETTVVETIVAEVEEAITVIVVRTVAIIAAIIINQKGRIHYRQQMLCKSAPIDFCASVLL